MRAKNVDFEVTYIDLRDKPDWFLKISPHGKVPVLNVGDDVLFESNAIAEFLDETVAPRLHPEDPIERARNRAWTDFVPDFARALSAVYYAKDKEAVDKAIEEAPARLQKLEDALANRGNDGPYFNGPKFSLVDCAYTPFLQRFMIVDRYVKSGLLDKFPLVKAWAEALLANKAVDGSVVENFDVALGENLKRRGLYMGDFFEAKSAAE